MLNLAKLNYAIAEPQYRGIKRKTQSCSILTSLKLGLSDLILMLMGRRDF